MKHLFEIISNSFGRFAQHKLASLDIWGGAFSQVRTSLQDGLTLCEKWASASELLTAQFWKQYPLHQWKGAVFVSTTLSQLIQRFEEVLSLRSLHEQLVKLLSPSEQQELSLATSFTPFTGMKLIMCCTYTPVATNVVLPMSITCNMFYALRLQCDESSHVLLLHTRSIFLC